MSLEWTAQFHVTSPSESLPGDKILLPQSALEQLLAAAPTVASNDTNLSQGSSFDPFNPYSFAAERHARAQSRYEHQQLPYPLTFRLVNPSNNRVVHAGIKEFSAEEGRAGLSPFLAQALGIEFPSRPVSSSHEKSTITSAEGSDGGQLNGNKAILTTPESQEITVHAKQLPKGTYVKLRPLEAGYDPEDWKSLLEEYLRKNFTTLSKGEILAIPVGRSTGGKAPQFQFLIDEFKPDGDGICVVDTDLEVDIEALNEEQARETLRKIATKAHKAPGTTGGSSPGGRLDLFRAQEGQILDGEYVDYELPSWDRGQGLEIEMNPASEEDALDLFVSPFSARQRAKPRDDEHVFHVYDCRPSKRIRLSPTNVELEGAEAVWISVHAPSSTASATIAPAIRYSIRATPYDVRQLATPTPTDRAAPTPHSPDEVCCSNCGQYVPQRSLMLHENFCLRNNILCPRGCGQMFQKRSDNWQNHWHCPHDTFYGNTASSHQHHDSTFHQTYTCPNCNHIATSLPSLAQHRTSTCPGKLILCKFCLLVVPQEGDLDGVPNHEALLSGLTPHELADGARTTECHMCNRIVRLRDMTTHLKHHDLERLSRTAPRMCRNIYCGRTLDGTSKSGDTRAGSRMGQGAGNDVGLCSTCFGPLYVSMYDPEGKALKRRVERRYLSQLLSGCGKGWCRNEFCKAGRKNTGTDPTGTAVTTKDAIPMVKPFVDGLIGESGTPLHFCVDEGCQRRRVLAEMMAAEGRQTPGLKEYGMEWCIGALEAEGGNLDKAREWLKSFAPLRTEER